MRYSLAQKTRKIISRTSIDISFIFSISLG